MERTRVRQRLDPVPYMPALIPAQLAQWLEDRQADLEEALSLGGANRILELTSKLSEGAERLAEMRGGMSPREGSRCTVFAESGLGRRLQAARPAEASQRQRCSTPSSKIWLAVQRSPPLKRRTVPIVEGGEFAVREQWWEVPSTMI